MTYECMGSHTVSVRGDEQLPIVRVDNVDSCAGVCSIVSTQIWPSVHGAEAQHIHSTPWWEVRFGGGDTV